MVVDLVSTDGREAHVVQRLYWSLTEGGLAVALLVAGGNGALKALQAVSLMSGLPFTIFVCLICGALLRVLKYDELPDMVNYYKQWNLPLYEGFFNIIG